MDVVAGPVSVTRLGKFVESRLRPVGVYFYSKNKRWEVPKQINAVRVHGVFASKGLTRNEWEQNLPLRKELQIIKEEHPENVYKIEKRKTVKMKKSGTCSSPIG